LSQTQAERMRRAGTMTKENPPAGAAISKVTKRVKKLRGDLNKRVPVA